MQKYFGIAIITLFIITVLIRSFSLKKQGIKAIEFGRKDKKDFVILPFALFYIYLIIANAFNLPTIPKQVLFFKETLAWTGVAGCGLSLCLFIWAIISFKKSFRVGLLENKSEGLVTNGAFAVSRNPIYVAFGLMLIGQFLIFPSWIFLIYIIIGIATFHRQVLKEERFLSTQYGDDFQNYCKKTRRYL